MKPGRGPPSKISLSASVAPTLPKEVITVQFINKPKTYVNHTYRDFSRVPPEPTDNSERHGRVHLEEMTFNQKVHHILSDDSHSQWISWMPHGRSFRIHSPLGFERNISELYFGHRRYSGFLRKLKDHGYNLITRGVDRGCFYHQCMLKEMPHLVKFMPVPRNIRRRIEDPQNEPNFYQISTTHPLPCDPSYTDSKEASQTKRTCDSPAIASKFESKEPPTTCVVEGILQRLATSSVPEGTVNSMLGPLTALLSHNNEHLLSMALARYLGHPFPGPFDNQNYPTFEALLSILQGTNPSRNF